jgi:hypothetical protein
MIIDVNNPEPKYGEITPSIKTELITLGDKSVVKVTIRTGKMTVTSYSDEIPDSPKNPIQEYVTQATLRAMSLVPNS